MTTKRYRLRPEVAEHEFEISDRLPVAGIFTVSVGGRTISASRELFEEIVPAIPPEPGLGRWEVGHCVAVRSILEHPQRWLVAGEDGLCTWETLVIDHAGGPDVQIVRLVPERPAPAVELPWEGSSAYRFGVRVAPVDDPGFGCMRVIITNPEGQWLADATLSAATGRDMAAALNAAADQGEAVGT